MHKITDATELEHELRSLLNYAQTVQPSRTLVASKLEELSKRLAGAADNQSEVYRLCKLVTDSSSSIEAMAQELPDAIADRDTRKIHLIAPRIALELKALAKRLNEFQSHVLHNPAF
jgi:hypothetical protein